MIPILLLQAEPMDEERLRLGEELRSVQERLQLGRYGDRFRLEVRSALRTVDLVQALLDVQPRFVHFSGHGYPNGGFCFEDELGNRYCVPPEAVANVFAQFTGVVECVLINACHSEPLARSLAKHIPFAIGMSRDVGDDAAIAFSIGFYQSLAAGRSIPDSYGLGRAQLGLRLEDPRIPILVHGCDSGDVSGRQGNRLKPSVLDPSAREAMRDGYDLLLAGDSTRARAILQKALDNAPLDPQVNFYLAVAKLQGRNPRNCDWTLIRDVERGLLTAARGELIRVSALMALALVKREHYERNHRQQHPPTVKDILHELSSLDRSRIDWSVLRHIACSEETQRWLKRAAP